MRFSCRSVRFRLSRLLVVGLCQWICGQIACARFLEQQFAPCQCLSSFLTRTYSSITMNDRDASLVSPQLDGSQAILVPHLLIQVVLRQILWHFMFVHIFCSRQVLVCSRSPISHNNSKVARNKEVYGCVGSTTQPQASSVATEPPPYPPLVMSDPGSKTDSLPRNAPVCLATVVTVAMDSHSHLQP